ncbi:hypothetical protein WMY93_033602, partial [Mugilogobius chulae]
MYDVAAVAAVRASGAADCKQQTRADPRLLLRSHPPHTSHIHWVHWVHSSSSRRRGRRGSSGSTEACRGHTEEDTHTRGTQEDTQFLSLGSREAKSELTS